MIRQSSQRGSVLVAGAITTLVVFGIGALAIDASYLYEAKSELQNTVDAAALAAASGLRISPQEARGRAMEYANLNPILGGQPLVLKAGDIDFGTWDSETRTFTPGAAPADSVQVTARLNDASNPPAPTLFFAPILGVRSVNITASATATIQSNFDTMFILDRTSDIPDDTLTDMKETATELLDRFSDAKDRGGVEYFHSQPDTNLGSALTSDFAGVRQSLIPGPPPDGNPISSNKNIAKALDFALQELTSTRANPGAVHAAVLLSPGNTTHPPNKAEAEALKYAGFLKNAGIRLYTITFPGPNVNQALMEQMASITGGANFVAPINLDEVFTAITTAEEQRNARLVE